MENKPALSIIVPLYNAEKFIDKCMSSILAQTFTDYEVILVNDGSTDRSGELCRRYQSANDRVIYIEKENGGAGSARNLGRGSARGEYLAFPDVDDRFSPDMYRELYDLAKSGNYDVVFSGVNYYKQSEGGEPVYSRTDNIKAAALHTQRECRENIMTFFPTTTIFDVPWNKLYKRSVAAEHNVRFSDTRRCQDAMFNLDFFNHINSAASTDKAYYNYLENTAEDVQRKFPKDYINIVIRYYTHLINTLTGWGVYGGDIRTHYDTTFVLAIYSTASRFDNPLWGLSKKEQEEYIEDILSRPEITAFLPTAQVRDDAKDKLEILKSKNAKAIIKLRKKETSKEKLRQNKLLMSVYRKLKNSMILCKN